MMQKSKQPDDGAYGDTGGEEGDQTPTHGVAPEAPRS